MITIQQFILKKLDRLVELHYKLGLTNEAEKYARLLGYNYESSEWYEASYKILNKSYDKRQKIIPDDRDTILKV